MSAARPPTSCPVVSIVVPSLNQGQFIRDALDSLLRQSYGPIEIVVVDGGSTDATVRILDDYAAGGALRYVSEPDCGQGDAIRKGIAMTSGEFVGWLNADDYLPPGSVEAAVAALVDDKSIGLAYGCVIDVDIAGQFERLNAGRPHSESLLARVDIVPQVGALFRREAYEACGGIRIDLKWTLDWELWLRMSHIARLQYVNSVVGYGRIHDNRKTAQGGWRRRAEILHVSRMHAGVFSSTVLACGFLNAIYFVLRPLNLLTLGRRDVAEALVGVPFAALRFLMAGRPFMV